MIELLLILFALLVSAVVGVLAYRAGHWVGARRRPP